MPSNVPTSFNKFLGNIELSGSHSDTAESRNERIISLLENHFTILEAFPTGSIARDTAIKEYADLDIMVVLHYSKHIKGKLPSVVLQNVRDALGDYRTGVRKNGQAVTLHYNSWPNVDVVPVSRTDNKDGTVRNFNVPDMNSEKWIVSRPRKHSNQMDAKNKSSGIKFKQIVKMIKHWNKQHSGILQSYHIEVMALQTLDSYIDEYTWHIYKYFENAVNLIQSPLWYEDSFVDDYLDDDKRNQALTRLTKAKELAGDAWSLTYNPQNDHKKAIEIWQQIFGNKFPSYGN
jgi:hypothetical protein